MEVLTSQGLLISPNVAIPVVGLADENSSKETSEDSSPQSDTSSAASAVSSAASGISCNQLTMDRRRDPKWNKCKLFCIFYLIIIQLNVTFSLWALINKYGNFF